MSTAPVAGKRTIGNSEVAGIGIASVIHQVAIHAVVAPTVWPAGERFCGLVASKIAANNRGPRTRPIRLRSP
jgi:hypothetical protein